MAKGVSKKKTKRVKKEVTSKSKKKEISKKTGNSKNVSDATLKLVNALYTKNMDDLVIALSENADANHMITKKDGTILFPVLHKAVENMDKIAVELLLESGADPNGEGARTNILQSAMLHGDNSKTNFIIIDILLDAGANPLKQNKNGFHAKSTAGFIERKKNNPKYLKHITTYLDNHPEKTKLYVEELRREREKNMSNSKKLTLGRSVKKSRRSLSKKKSSTRKRSGKSKAKRSSSVSRRKSRSKSKSKRSKRSKK